MTAFLDAAPAWSRYIGDNLAAVGYYLAGVEAGAPNPRAEVCPACGNWIRTLKQRCEWDGAICAAGKRRR